MGYRNRASCRSLFKRLEILPLASQYILSLMLFVVKNIHFFISNSENHTKGTRQLNNLYHPITNLNAHQKGVLYIGIMIFNNLPPYIKDISNNVKSFVHCLKQFLQIHSFYSLEEYFNTKIFTSWNCSYFLTICYTNVCQCVICVRCFTHYKCWHSYLTVPLFWNYVL